jgi:glycosyltransferase involved in cell wall biosynthesis
MKNILHIGKYYHPDVGGIENVTASLAQGAVEAGHIVTVVSFCKNLNTRYEIIRKVHVFKCSVLFSISSQPIGIRYVLRCLNEIRKSDLVHLHYPNILGLLCAFFIFGNRKLVVHWHSDVIDKGFLGKIFSPLETFILHRADSIIATSENYLLSSNKLTLYKEKVVVIPIGIEDKSVVKKEFILSPYFEKMINNRNIILSVGRIVDYKGFLYLIKSANFISLEAVVVIVGAGPGEKALQLAIEQNFLSDRVVMAGKLDDSDLQSLFARATIYALPSINRAEAFGVVLLEAMSHGLPIVACEIPGSGVPWVNKHGVSGLNVPVGDAQAFADACNEILADEKLRAFFAAGSRRRFEEQFTDKIAIESTNRLYLKLMNSVAQ